jgi:hypothetical protein
MKNLEGHFLLGTQGMDQMPRMTVRHCLVGGDRRSASLLSWKCALGTVGCFMAVVGIENKCPPYITRTVAVADILFVAFQ